MSINIGTDNQVAPQAPQEKSGDGVTDATWVDPNEVQNAVGPENLGMIITDHSTLVGSNATGFIRVGIQPTPSTVVQSTATNTTPLIFDQQLRRFTEGPITQNI